MKNSKLLILRIVLSLLILFITVFLIIILNNNLKNKEKTDSHVVSLSYTDGYKGQIHQIPFQSKTPGKTYEMKLVVSDGSTNEKLDEILYNFTPETSEGILEIMVYYKPDVFKSKTIIFEDIFNE